MSLSYVFDEHARTEDIMIHSYLGMVLMGKGELRYTYVVEFF